MRDTQLRQTRMSLRSSGLCLLSTICTNGKPYTIALNGGLSAATDPTKRKMTRGTSSVVYGLYSDQSFQKRFGETTGVNTHSGQGSGVAQSVPVYGRVASQPTPPPGTCSDTITATVTY